MHRFVLWACFYLRTLSAGTCITSGIGILFSRYTGLKSAVHPYKELTNFQKGTQEYKKSSRFLIERTFCLQIAS